MVLFIIQLYEQVFTLRVNPSSHSSVASDVIWRGMTSSDIIRLKSKRENHVMFQKVRIAFVFLTFLLFLISSYSRFVPSSGLV